MPTGSLTPSWPSTVKSRGRTCRTSRLDGMVTARATSVARSMSSRLTSRAGPLTATVPREFEALEVVAADTHEGRLQAQAGEALGLLDGLVDRADGLLDVVDDALLEARSRAGVPLPMMFRPRRPATSPTSTTTLLVPTSSATRTASISTVGILF